MPTDLHLALQRLYADADGLIEAPLGAYRADVLRDGICYEIQTRGFGVIRRKLESLLADHPVVLIHPVALQKVIVQVDGQGREISARKSPKQGRLTDLFAELVHLRGLLTHPNLSLEVLLTVERELRRKDGLGSRWRGGVSVVGRELAGIVERHRFEHPGDLLRLLPETLPAEFTVAELKESLGLKGAVAGKMAYALRELAVTEQVGKRGNAYVYRRVREKRRRSRRRAAPDA